MCSATFSELEAEIVKKVLGLPIPQSKVYRTAKEFQTSQKLPITSARLRQRLITLVEVLIIKNLNDQDAP